MNQTNKTLTQVINFYQMNSAQDLFSEMSNCLEMRIDESNWKENLSQFEASYNNWVNSFLN